MNEFIILILVVVILVLLGKKRTKKQCDCQTHGYYVKEPTKTKKPDIKPAPQKLKE